MTDCGDYVENFDNSWNFFLSCMEITHFSLVFKE